MWHVRHAWYCFFSGAFFYAGLWVRHFLCDTGVFVMRLTLTFLLLHATMNEFCDLQSVLSMMLLNREDTSMKILDTTAVRDSQGNAKLSRILSSTYPATTCSPPHPAAPLPSFRRFNTLLLSAAPTLFLKVRIVKFSALGADALALRDAFSWNIDKQSLPQSFLFRCN